MSRRIAISLTVFFFLYFCFLFSYSSGELTGKGGISYLIESIACDWFITGLFIVWAVSLLVNGISYPFYVLYLDNPAEWIMVFPNVKRSIITSSKSEKVRRGIRFSIFFLRSSFFKVAVATFMVVFLLSIKTRFSSEILLGEGEEKTVIPRLEMEGRYSWALEWRERECRRWGNFRGLERWKVKYIKAFPPTNTFYNFFVEWNIKAHIRFISPLGEKREVYAEMFPPVNVMGYYIQVADFGVAPGFEVKTAEGRIIDRVYYILKDIPPGTEDSFSLPNLPFLFYLRIDALNDVRALLNGHYSFVLRVKEGSNTIFEKKVKPGDEVEVGRYILHVLSPRTWVNVSIMKDKMVGWIFLSFFLLLLSIIHYFISLLIPSFAWLVFRNEDVVFILSASTSPIFSSKLHRELRQKMREEIFE